MYTLIMNKPMHKCTLGRHHMRILLRFHLRLLLCRQIGAGIPRRLLSKLGAMGWRHEFGGLFEDEGF